MRTVIHSMSVSLDGYVNGPDGTFDWSAPDAELHQFHNDRTRGLAAQLCGRRLYETMGYWDGDDDARDAVADDFAELWRPIPKIVFSSTLTDDQLGPNARLATASAADEIRAIEDGRVGVGGPTLAGELTAHGLIDEYHVFVIPVIVGGGTPYLSPGAPFTKLELVDQRSFAQGVTHLRYHRVN
jgi:dihydrofolate reductase